MAGELILFPVRLYFRAARFAVRTGLHVTEQAGRCDPAELAAVQLYESAHKQCETVTAAAARELRAKSAAR